MFKVQSMRRFLCILAAMVFAAASLYGQPEAGHYGTVTDERGDTVPYAIVSVMNLGGHIIFNSVCDESGRFHLLVSIFLKAFPTVNISSRSRAWATA